MRNGFVIKAGVAIIALVLAAGLVGQQSEPTQGQSAPQTPAPEQSPAQPSPSTAAPRAEQSPAATQPAPTPLQTEGPKLVRKRKKKTLPKKTGAEGNAQNDSGRVVVRNGGARDTAPQISPGMGNEQAAHAKETTSELLATTEANVKRLGGRQLSANQQSMLDQIKTYIRQSKQASESGDVDRAHTLAFKAHLLSDELARH